MRKSIVAGNWKMNGSRASVAALLQGITLSTNEKAEVIVFPPFVFLEQTQQSLTGTPIAWGGQNMNAKPSGAYTGEVSAEMLKEFGARYVLLGHSERRQLFAETDEIIAEKYRAALQAGLSPVICVGETLAERKAGKTEQVIQRQLNAILAQPQDVQGLRQAIIAYEPVWAIGTGLSAEPSMAEEVHHQIRELICARDKEIASGLRILYGGSVKGDNARALFAMPNIDGALVGGASLNPQEFLDIVRLCNN